MDNKSDHDPRICSLNSDNLEALSLIRVFETGASRDSDEGKLDYEGFLSPIVLQRYAEYMHKNRFMKDGSVRESDNWQKGMDVKVYMKSLCRHFMACWLYFRRSGTYNPLFFEEALCGVLFNVMGILHEVLKPKKSASEVAAEFSRRYSGTKPL